VVGIDGGGRETEAEATGRFFAFLRCWIVIRALKELGRADAFFTSDSGWITVTSGWLLVFRMTLMLPEEATDFNSLLRKSEAAKKSGVRNPEFRKSTSQSDGVADVLTQPNVIIVRLRTTCPSSTDSLSWISTTSVMTGLPESLRSGIKCRMTSGSVSGSGGGLLDGSDGAADETDDATERPQKLTGISSGFTCGCPVRNTGGGGLGGGIFFVRILDVIPEFDIIPEVDVIPEFVIIPEFAIFSEVDANSEFDIIPEVDVIPEFVIIPEFNIIPEFDANSEFDSIPEFDANPEFDSIPEFDANPEFDIISEVDVNAEVDIISEVDVNAEVNIIPEVDEIAD